MIAGKKQRGFSTIGKELRKEDMTNNQADTITEIMERTEFEGWRADMREECPEWLRKGTICSHPDGLFCDHRAIVVNGRYKVEMAKLIQDTENRVQEEAIDGLEKVMSKLRITDIIPSSPSDDYFLVRVTSSQLRGMKGSNIRIVDSYEIEQFKSSLTPTTEEEK